MCIERKLITVLTPTYNRGYILSQLYESLCRQTNQNFCWLIVDDGSNDNTKELITDWNKEKLIDIQYVYQENGGKHRAHNTGVRNCNTELIMICDSDDYLLDNVIEIVSKNWMKCKDNSNVGGMVGYRGQYVGERLQTSKNLQFPSDNEYETITNIFNHSPIFETTQIYRTDVLKQYLFPEIDGENFFPEIWCWRAIDRQYKVYIVREILEIYEYLEDGYTKSGKVGIRNCPVAYAMLFYQQFENSKDLLHKIIEYGKLRGLWYLYKDKRIPQKGLIWNIISFPVAIVSARRYRSKNE